MMPTVPNLGSCIIMPRSGLMTMASILSEQTSYDVTLLFEPYCGDVDPQRIVDARPRFVLLNGLTTTAVENELLVHELRRRSEDPLFVIAGGEHATMFPHLAKRYADVIVLYEGDGNLTTVLAALENPEPAGRDRALAEIPGIWFRDSAGEWQTDNRSRRQRTIDYRYDMTVFSGSRKVRHRLPLTQLPVQASRGCVYFCSFCSWTSLFGKAGYVTRPVEDFLHDVEHAFEHTEVDRYMVVDNLFGADVETTTELLEGIVRRFEGRTRKPSFTVLCRADQFADGGENRLPDSFLKLMRRAGVWNVSMGLESVENHTLEDMRKEADTSVYVGAAERLHDFDFKVAASFIAGYADDDVSKVRNIADFADKIGCFTIQLYCQGITPRTRDWKRLLHRRIPGHPMRFLNGHSVSTFPKRILPSVLQKTLFETADDFCRNAREPQRRIVGRIYRKVWRGMKPLYEALEQIEEDVLLPEKIYVEDGAGDWALDEERLKDLFADREAYEDFARRVEEVFDPLRYPNGVEPPMPLPRDPLPGAGFRGNTPERAWAEARQLGSR